MGSVSTFMPKRTSRCPTRINVVVKVDFQTMRCEGKAAAMLSDADFGRDDGRCGVQGRCLSTCHH